MGKALLIIVIAVGLGGSILMFQQQGTELQTEQAIAGAEATFLAREAARSGYDIGLSAAAANFASQPTRTNVATADVPQGSYDLTVEQTAVGTIEVTATGRASHRNDAGTMETAEHTLWGEFSRITEAPAAVVIDATEVTSTLATNDFAISGNDRRPTSAAGSSAESGSGTASYAVLATQPNVASALWAGLGSGQQGLIEGRGQDGATGSVAEQAFPALLQSIYEEAMGRVSTGANGVVSFVGDRTFAGAETFGSSATNPVIVHVGGNATIQGRVQGFGVLIVDGDLTIEGSSPDAADNFAWEGLVYVRNDGEVSFSQTGATRIEGGLVVQAPPVEPEADPVDFSIDDLGVVTVNERFAARAEVLGAAISYSGDYDMPVTLELAVGGDVYAPWGSTGQPVSANVNDGLNPRSYDFPNIYDAGAQITIQARSFRRTAGASGSADADWFQHMSVESGRTNNTLVKVLRNGDSVPAISGFLDQRSIASFVDGYVTDGRVRLADNQAIYLFELGQADLNSAAADFQDVVVLVTLSGEETLVADGFAGDAGSDGDSTGARGVGTLSRAHFEIGDAARIQYSSEAIGRLAAQLQSARSASAVKSVKQRSFDPDIVREVMPETAGTVELGDDTDSDPLITVCVDGATEQVPMSVFESLGEVATLGGCAANAGEGVLGAILGDD